MAIEPTLTSRHISLVEDESSKEQLLKNGQEKEPEEVKEEEEPTDKKPKSSLQYQYTRDELFKLSSSAPSKKRPAFLDPIFNNGSGKWDPESWFNSQRWAEEGRPKLTSLDTKRRLGPGDRLKDEREEAALSPQRRHLPPPSQSCQRKGSSSPTDFRDLDSGFSWNKEQPGRRLPGGRVLSRGDKDRSFRNRDRYDFDDGGESRRYSNSRFNHDRRINDRNNRITRDLFGRPDDRIEEEEEPEWFSSGPTSQSETIELVGFEADEKKFRRVGPTGVKRSRENSRRHSTCSEEEESSPPAPTVAPAVTSEEKAPPEVKQQQQPASRSEEAVPPEPASGTALAEDFDLNQILQMDWLPDMLMNGSSRELGGQLGEGGGATSSRFSQWFKSESPELLEEEEGTKDLVVQVLNGIGDLGLTDSAPAGSPWERPRHHHHHHHNTSTNSRGSSTNNILEVLQSANLNIEPLLMGADFPPPPAARSVEELEAGLKKMVLNKPPSQQSDTTAFNKLLQHLDKGMVNAVSMGPLDKSKALQEKDLLQANYPPPPPTIFTRPSEPQPAREQQPHVAAPNTFFLGPHMLRSSMAPPPTQPELLLKMMGASPQPVSPSHHHHHHHGGAPGPRPPPVSAAAAAAALLQQQQQQREYLASFYKPPPPPSRPTQEMFLGLPPGLSPRQSPLQHDRVPSPLMFGQQPPALSHAPAPIHPSSSSNSLQVQGGVLPRVPSPQELAVHTQSILQQALIKRKLEEQKEKSRKSQQAAAADLRKSPTQQQMHQPSGGSKPLMATTFTPASVMRKLHAEKQDKDSGLRIAENGQQLGEDGVPRGKAIQGQGLFTQQQPTQLGRGSTATAGRPIVKGADYFLKNGGLHPTQLAAAKMMEQHLLQQQIAAAVSQQQQQQRLRNLAAVNPLMFRMHHRGAPAPAPPPPIMAGPRDPRQLRAPLHPVTLHQLLLNSQQQQQQRSPHPQEGGSNFMSGGGTPIRGSHLNPPAATGGASSSRHSPVNNLTKWFNNDVLKQKVAELPPVPHQNALLVEEVERQQAVQN